MAKQIKNYMTKLVDITPVSDTALSDWTWRCRYIGIEGVLMLFESEHKRPGELFLKIVSRDGRYLKTSYGIVEIYENNLVFTTKQSRYNFVLR
ncbi:MAG: hypothetical protein IJX55_05355 [Clostridia bacterium]|nr:hypothetical protein [Clostridia bacterium]